MTTPSLMPWCVVFLRAQLLARGIASVLSIPCSCLRHFVQQSKQKIRSLPKSVSLWNMSGKRASKFNAVTSCEGKKDVSTRPSTLATNSAKTIRRSHSLKLSHAIRVILEALALIHQLEWTSRGSQEFLLVSQFSCCRDETAKRNRTPH